MAESLLTELIEEPLGSVTFVQDYVQLDFGDARFTAYAWPWVTIGSATLRFGDPGYRDALCAFITHEVTAVEESPEVGLSIRFALGAIITDPEPADLTGPEVAQLHVYDVSSPVTGSADDSAFPYDIRGQRKGPRPAATP